VKLIILILAVIALCGCGFFFWYRALPRPTATAGVFPMTVAINIEMNCGGFLSCPFRAHVYVTEKEKGTYLVAKNLLVLEFSSNPGKPTTATLAVNPIQAFRLSGAQKKGPLSMGSVNPKNQELPVFTLEELLGEVEPPTAATPASPDR
jgi:hypothetical protein